MSGKLALKYAGADVDSMKSIAKASKNRSLMEFQQVSDNLICKPLKVIESIRVSKRNRPQRDFATVVFNNQVELERYTSNDNKTTLTAWGLHVSTS